MPSRTIRLDRLTAALGAAVMLVSAIILLPGLGSPRGAIWDESYYLGATARYELGRTQFASHPPLGLMLIAVGDRAWAPHDLRDLESLAATKSVRGESIPPRFDFTGVRLASALFGVAAAGLFFVLMLLATGSAPVAAALSGLFLFQTALIAQFRAAQLDAFQVAFVLAALIAAARALERRSLAAVIGFGLCVGLATMVRANAILLAAGGLVIVHASWHRDGLARAFRDGLTMLAGFGLAVVATFATHLLVAPRAPDRNIPAGVTDAAWVSPQLQAYFDTGTLTPMRLLAGVRDYTRFMRADLDGMPLTDANGSSPWGWPLGWRPIQYRWDGADDQTAFIVLIPNYPSWWLAFAGVLLGAVAWIRGRRSPLLTMTLGLWLVFMGVHVWLASQRVLYLYNYFIPLLLGWLCLAALVRTESWTPAGLRRRLTTTRIAVAAVIGGFLLTMPLALHHRVANGGPWEIVGSRLGR